MMFGLIEKGINLIGKVLGKDKAGPVNEIKNILAGNPDLKQKLKMLEFQEAESLRELYKAEIASSDKFVRRARPGMLWLIFVIIAANYILIPIINSLLVLMGKAQIILVYPNLPEPVYWLFGSIFGLYTGARSIDKWKNGSKK
jgi:hypothetical protein